MGIGSTELDRQYRVAKQTLGLHAMMRDQYGRRARGADLLLMACSIIFCSTTFAGDDLYKFLKVRPETARIVLGIASVVALIASTAALLTDWHECCGQHADAFRKWSSVVELFRRHRGEDGSWPADKLNELQSVYWKAGKESASIPDGKFNALKARYLRTVEISKLESAFPGCPRLILWAIVRARGTALAIKAGLTRGERKADDEQRRTDAVEQH